MDAHTALPFGTRGVCCGISIRLAVHRNRSKERTYYSALRDFACRRVTRRLRFRDTSTLAYGSLAMVIYCLQTRASANDLLFLDVSNLPCARLAQTCTCQRPSAQLDLSVLGIVAHSSSCLTLLDSRPRRLECEGWVLCSRWCETAQRWYCR